MKNKLFFLEFSVKSCAYFSVPESFFYIYSGKNLTRAYWMDAGASTAGLDEKLALVTFDHQESNVIEDFVTILTLLLIHL